MAKTIVYVDGFNLYYGCLKRTAYRWLDLGAFAQKMLPRDQIIGIKYFTAKVDVRPDHPNAQAKQKMYLRALRTLPDLSIYYGRFLTTEIDARRVRSRVGRGYVRVWKTEEKGSDVNLATHLLVDGFQKEYELAVVAQMTVISRLQSNTSATSSDFPSVCSTLARIGATRYPRRSSPRGPSTNQSALGFWHQVSLPEPLSTPTAPSQSQQAGDFSPETR